MKRTATAVALGAVILAGIAGPRTAWADHHRCSNFSSQAEAQAHYRNDPFGGAHTGEGHSSLDDNSDGVACEALPGPYDLVPVSRNVLAAVGRSGSGSGTPLPQAGAGEAVKSGGASVALAALVCCAGSAFLLRLRRRSRAG